MSIRAWSFFLSILRYPKTASDALSSRAASATGKRISEKGRAYWNHRRGVDFDRFIRPDWWIDFTLPVTGWSRLCISFWPRIFPYFLSCRSSRPWGSRQEVFAIVCAQRNFLYYIVYYEVFFFKSMCGLCDEGYESLGQATLNVWDVDVTQHSKWAAKRVRRGLFWTIDCRSPQVVGPVVQWFHASYAVLRRQGYWQRSANEYWLCQSWWQGYRYGADLF